MFDAVIGGLVQVAQWPAIGYLVLGVLIGLFFGAVPGLSGLVGMAILLPFTFDMTPVSAFAFLLGMYAVTTTSDTLASVLLGVPGTAASQATILDGYPMAKRGEAARALGAAFAVSAAGGILGAIMLGLSIPAVKPLIMSFAKPEFFMLGVLGLTMVGALSGGSMAKGLLTALLGVMFAMVGYSIQGGNARFHFESVYLLDGLHIIPVVLGLFAIPEILDLAARNRSISQVPREQISGGIWLGVTDALRHWWLVIRSAAIGMYIGLLPGLGGAIVDWVAYGHAVQSAKDKSGFGKGDIRGVIAPETANNAMKGPALLPTIAFGIPGNASMAILLGAFIIQGLTPGPELLTVKLDLTFSLLWTLVIANVLGAILLMAWSTQLSKIIFLRGNLIVPPIVLFVFMGAWMANNAMGDWIVLLAFGLLGQVMKVAGWPRPPLVLGLILGKIMENALDISLQSYGIGFVLRPITLVIAAIVVLTVVITAIGAHRKWRNRHTAAGAGETVEESRGLSLLLGLLAVGLFAYAIPQALAWPIDAKLLPLVAAIPGVTLALIVLTHDGVTLRRSAIETGAGIWRVAGGTVMRGDESRRTGYLLLWLLALVVGTWLLGQQVTLPLFMLIFLKFWARESWTLALGQALAGLAFLYILFDWLIAVIWQEPALFG